MDEAAVSDCLRTHKVLFICGVHKSGTSILHTVLRTHRKISGFRGTGVPEDEGQHLQTVFLPASKFGGPGKFAFHRASSLDHTSELLTEANKQQLCREWMRHWDLSREVLVEKSPPNIVRSLFLQSVFENSYFLLIKRHPVVVALATQKWTRSSTSRLVRHWLVAHERWEQDKKQLKHCLEVRYEDLIAHPLGVVGDIARFIDIDPAGFDVSSLRQDAGARYQEDMRRSRGIFVDFVRYRLRRRFAAAVEPFGYTIE